MSVGKESMSAYAAAVVKQYQEVNGLITDGLHNKIPQEVGIELQHMLMHLVAADKQAGINWDSSILELSSALGHVDRAFLDGCKCIMHQEFSRHSQSLPFRRDWVETRLLERQSHSRGTCTGGRGEQMPAPNNPLCDHFKKFLRSQGLLPASWVGPGTTPQPQAAGTWNRWKEFFPSVECWLCLDLFYSALRNKKHHGALQSLLLSFIDLDSERLERLNLQFMLDILVSGGVDASALGWQYFADLKQHYPPFIKTYILNIGPAWHEQDVTAEKDWIYPLFKELWQFYVPTGAPPAWPYHTLAAPRSRGCCHESS